MKSQNNHCSILLICEHKMLCEGLSALLGREDDLRVSGTAQDMKKGLAAVRSIRPTIVIADDGIPGAEGGLLLAGILKEYAEARVIMLLTAGDNNSVNQLFGLGAVSVIRKSSAYKELLQAIRIVRQGGTFYNSFTQQIMQEHGMPARGKKTAQLLSDRERGVVALLADGYGTQEISEKLGLSPKTVETHRRKILLKLGLTNIAELTKYALREGLTLL